MEKELTTITDEQEEISRRRQIDWMRETSMAVVVSEEQGEVDKFESGIWTSFRIGN
jgi:type I restriction enzyme, R subunit